MADDRAEAVLRPTGKIDESDWQAVADPQTHAVAAAIGFGPAMVRFGLSGALYMSLRGLTFAREAAADRAEIALAAANRRLNEIPAISRDDTIFRTAD